MTSAVLEFLDEETGSRSAHMTYPHLVTATCMATSSESLCPCNSILIFDPNNGTAGLGI